MKLPAMNRASCVQWVWQYGLVTFLLVYTVLKILGSAIFGDQPTPATPPNGFVAHENRVLVSWSASGDYPSYHLQVAEEGDFSSLVYSLETTRTATRLPTLEPGKRYCWRVLADDSARVSCFRIADIQVMY